MKELQKFFRQLKMKGHEVLQVVYEDLSSSLDSVRRWVLRGTHCTVAAERTEEHEPGAAEDFGGISVVLETIRWVWLLNIG